MADRAVLYGSCAPVVSGYELARAISRASSASGSRLRSNRELNIGLAPILALNFHGGHPCVLYLPPRAACLSHLNSAPQRRAKPAPTDRSLWTIKHKCGVAAGKGSPGWDERGQWFGKLHRKCIRAGAGMSQQPACLCGPGYLLCNSRSCGFVLSPEEPFWLDNLPTRSRSVIRPLQLLAQRLVSQSKHRVNYKFSW